VLAAIVVCAVTVVSIPPIARAQDAAVSGTTAFSIPNDDAQSETGPERLKQEVRVTAETNTPGAVGATSSVKAGEKSFQWKVSWDGWSGLHYNLSQRTGIKEPPAALEPKILADVREKNQGTNASPVFRLEELKMSGKFGAKLQVDAAAFVVGNQFKGFDDGVELRRARIYARGDCLLLLPVSYELEIGYIPHEFYLENTYLALRNRPWIGDIKIGQYQAPMGLDAVTSSRDTTMMELASPLEALAPGVNAGVEIGRPVFDQRVTWKFGLFTEGTGHDVGEATKDYGRAISRITGLPVYQVDPQHPEATTLLHLGMSANVLYSASSSVRYRSRPESHLAPYVIDTGNMTADNAMVAAAEVAWVKGAFSVEGEYLRSWVNEKNGHLPGFDGVYASASWFLTGESRPYDRRSGSFARVIPRNDFNWGKGGWGAWELAGRYSFVNLDSADINGGRLSMLMTGMNWYLHSHVKWRFEYGFGHVSGRQPEGNLNIFQTRMEVDF
jgi:phosphate-selective porin OprO/OprP